MMLNVWLFLLSFTSLHLTGEAKWEDPWQYATELSIGDLQDELNYWSGDKVIMFHQRDCPYCE